MRDQDAIGFGQSSNWIVEWEKTFEPISKRNNAKPNQLRISTLYSENSSIILYTKQTCKCNESACTGKQLHTFHRGDSCINFRIAGALVTTIIWFPQRVPQGSKLLALGEERDRLALISSIGEWTYSYSRFMRPKPG